MSERTTRLVGATALAFTCASLVACGALIGTRDLTLVSDGGASSGSGVDANGLTVPDSGAGGNDATATPACTSATNFQTDKTNCGTCGHSCLGGECAGGVCQEVTIATGQDGAYAVAVDDTSVYWVSYTNSNVMKSAKDGTGLTQLATLNVDSPFDIALDDTYVYWANIGGSVARCAKTGCGGNAEIIASNLSNPTGVAVDAEHVFWAEYKGYDIGRASTDGGAFGYLQTNLNSAAHLIAVDDASVFFTMDNGVGKLPKDAPTVPTSGDNTTAAFTSIAVVTSPAFGVAVDGTNVYWATDDDPGVIGFAPKDGSGGAQTFASNQHYPFRVALDDANVYWVAYGPDTSPNDKSTLYVSGYVATCPKTGCGGSGERVLAGSLLDAEGLAVDSEAVYWAVAGNTAGEGAIVKLAK